MLITVAICTWNRSGLLKKTLDNLSNIKISSDFKWELLVVNNNCTDDTDIVIEQYAAILPIRRIFEKETGLSHARNAAVRAANGDYIIWTDDDVLVDERWLEAYVHAFEKYPESAVFGGPILPWFEKTPPSWLSENWDLAAGAFAARDLGTSEIPLDPNNDILPFGANFAVKTLIQSRVLYDPRLGLKGDTRILGEETAVINKILTSGNTGWWIPYAKVKHFIPIQRQTLKYLSQYYIGQGKTRRLQYGFSDNSVLLFGKPRWLYRKIIETQINYWIRRLLFGTSTSIEAMIEANIYLGLIKK